MNMSPWNKDRIIGQKRPLQISHIWGDLLPVDSFITLLAMSVVRS